ncbi:MAG TPA: adenylate/guanylate cyclase domain-containing protein [Pyrinomonadaceae bacterium]|jgi:class 3 adenylate cyclase
MATTEQPTRAALNDLLQERNEFPERAAEIDKKIFGLFGVTRAILVMDMSGFSRLTVEHGVTHFLAMIHRMHQVVLPAIEEHGGQLIKWEADNLFAVFGEVEAAVEAAVDILRRFSAANTMLPDAMDLHGKFGVGYGETLVVGGEDLYGCEVNLASKLGEDLAGREEILITEAAFARVDPDKRRYESVRMTISGLDLLVHRIKYDGAPASPESGA